MQRRHLWLLVGVVGTVCALHRPARSAPIGVVDAERGNEDLLTGVGFDAFRNEVAAAGHTLQRAILTPDGLQGLRAVIVTPPAYSRNVLSNDQINAIWDFVARGGGLVVVGEGGYETDSTLGNVNTLAAPFGVQFAGPPLAGSGEIVTGFVPHPVTTGVASVGLDYYRAMSSVASPAIDLTTGRPDFLAAVGGKGGGGNVVVIGDFSVFSNSSDLPLSYGDNRQLLRNILTYVTVPEPASSSLLLVAVAGLCTSRRWRRH